MSGAFDGLRKQALVRRADSTDSPGQYLSTLGNKMTEELSVFEIDIGDFLRAKFANPFAPNTESSWTWHSNGLSTVRNRAISIRFPVYLLNV
jgi:hypothetical protein